jgi:hypothetical protein
VTHSDDRQSTAYARTKAPRVTQMHAIRLGTVPAVSGGMHTPSDNKKQGEPHDEKMAYAAYRDAVRDIMATEDTFPLAVDSVMHLIESPKAID